MRDSEIKGCQILVVDDEPSVSQTIKMLLQHDGHTVETVDSGEAALELLEHRRFDLIITDFAMPGMKGDQLVLRIKQRWPNQPVIMATAFAAEFTTFGKTCGGVDFLLQKPFYLDELREAVAHALSGILNLDDSPLSDSNKPPPDNFIPPAPL